MEELEVVMVDITLLISTCRAAREMRAHAMSAHLRAHWHHLCTELKRATLAYADAFAHADQELEPDTTIAACRAAAEREMPGAIRLQHDLRLMAERQSDGLHGSTVVNDDLSRLSDLVSHLRRGGAALSHCATIRQRRHVKKAAQCVQQRLRRAITAYAGASIRGAGDHAIERARTAATGQLDRHCIDALSGLARLEEDGREPLALIQHGVARPLRHLRKDWKRPGIARVAW